MKEILDIIHKTIYQFFNVCGDDEVVPMSDKNKLLLEVNKAIHDNLKALEQEPFINKACVSSKVCKHDKEVVLDNIRAEIEALEEGMTRYHNDRPWIFKDEALQVIDKYRAESEEK